MRVLITGASGFIGSCLFERLARKGAEVAGLFRSAENASPSSLSRIEKLERCVREFPNARLISRPNISAACPEIVDFAPSACVHLAGRSSVRESLLNPGMYADANGAGTITVLEAARAAGCRRVIHASSVMIYGKDAPLPYNEQNIGSARASFYGASKLAAETLANTWRVLHGMETINLRLFSVYGPGLRPDCVPHLVASAILAGRDFNVFGDGSSVRDYVEIDDVLDAIEAAIGVRWQSDFPMAINIGSGSGTALIELVREIEQGLLKKAQLVYKPAVAAELQAIVADTITARRVLGWKPRVELRCGIARLTKWFKSM